MSGARKLAALAYAVLFVLLLPAVLVLWAGALERQLCLPRLGDPSTGWLLATLGAALLGSGWWALIRHGQGLPMNIAPPRRLVTTGVYALLPHPIYTGFTLLLAGYFMVRDLRAGLWLVTPCLSLGCAALVLGYEQHAQRRRFPEARWTSCLGLPADSPDVPGPQDRFSAFLLTWINPAPLPGAALVLGLLLAPTRTALRRFVLRGWVLIVLALLGAPGSLAVGLAMLATGFLPLALLSPSILPSYLVARFSGLIWQAALAGAERLANSFNSFRIGPARVLSHALWSGGAGLVGSLLASWLGGGWPFQALVLISGLLGAMLWGQLSRGQSNLSRPFGFFGGLAGGLLGLLLALRLGADPWRLAGALACALPFLQAAGRLRCLVQGCCHGRPGPGLTVRHPRSRVCYLAGLGGQSIYPTQLYSIASNLVLGPLLLRGFLLGWPLSVLTGGYLVLSGMARFVEESYRGEPQTLRRFGLALNQWFSVLAVGLGIACSSLTSPAAGPPVALTAVALVQALAMAFLGALALSVDFPDSDRPLSRLAPS